MINSEIVRFVAVNEPLLNGNEKEYPLECVKTGWVSSEGPFVKRFEKAFAKRIGRKYGVAVSSWTVAQLSRHKWEVPD